MYSILQHAHSGLRWLVLIFLVLAIVNAVSKRKGSATFGPKDKKVTLFALIFTHIQLILGLILYFISPKVIFTAETMGNRVARYFAVEHITMMVIAIVLITIGYSKAKKKENDQKKFNTIFIFYLIGLIVLLAGIPWPFMGLGTAWF